MFRRTRRPEKLLRVAYVAALIVIAFVAGLGLLVQYQYTSMEERVSNILAAISQQRIKVQEIALQATELKLELDLAGDPAQMSDLLANVDELEAEHQFILTELKLYKNSLLSRLASGMIRPKDVEDYRSLDSEIIGFIQSVRRLANNSLSQEVQGLQETARSYSDAILKVLSSLQESYFLQRQEKFHSLKDLQLGAFLSILFILLAAGCFVFYPIEVQVRQSRRFSEKAQRDAERANRIKTEFLANISHEIRTPLGAIMGFSDMVLCDPDCAEPIRDKVLSVKKSSFHLKSLIDEILDLSKIEAGSLDIYHNELNLMDLLHEVASIIQVRMREKSLHFSIRFLTPIPEMIISDSIRISQILINLLSNAAKFTEKGSVRLELSSQETASQKACLVFTVHDTGCGIPKDKQGLLFKRFSQLDRSNIKRVTGTGLGLILSKNLAELIGGRLKLLQSEPEVGSSFRLVLDCDLPQTCKMITDFSETISKKPDSIDLASLRGRLNGVRILLVEDGEDNQRIYRYFLELAGANVTSIWDGLKGLEYASDNDDFDLVLMDIQLPRMDGYTAAVELRRRGISKPIIALTAHALQEEKERCLRAGFSEYIAKPVAIPFLIKTVLRFAPVRESYEIANAPLYSRYHDQEIYHPMIREFADSLAARVEALQDTIAEGRLSDAASLCHKLKGSALTYGYDEFHETVVTLEHRLKEVVEGRSHSVESHHKLMDELWTLTDRIQAGARSIHLD